MSIKIMTMVWESDLSKDEKSILVNYADWANDDGESVWPSIGRIAWRSGYSERKVQMVTRALEEKGIMIKVGISKYRTYIYKIDVSKIPGRPAYNNEKNMLEGAHHAPLDKTRVHTVHPQGAHRAPNSFKYPLNMRLAKMKFNKTIVERKNNLNINEPLRDSWEPEKPTKSEKKKSTNEQPVKPSLVNHPAVIAYKEIRGTKTNPNKVQMQLIANAITDDLLDKWKVTVTEWLERGWSPVNIKGMIDYMQNGGSKKYQGNGNQPRASFLKQERNYPKDQVIAWFRDNQNRPMPPPFDWITPAIYERWIAMGKNGDALMSMTLEQFKLAEKEYKS